MSIQTKQGWRYVVKIPMGFDTAQWVSKDLFSTQGRAIDAALKAYPQGDYPDATISVMEDDEVVVRNRRHQRHKKRKRDNEQQRHPRYPILD